MRCARRRERRTTATVTCRPKAFGDWHGRGNAPAGDGGTALGKGSVIQGNVQNTAKLAHLTAYSSTLTPPRADAIPVVAVNRAAESSTKRLRHRQAALVARLPEREGGNSPRLGFLEPPSLPPPSRLPQRVVDSAGPAHAFAQQHRPPNSVCVPSQGLVRPPARTCAQRAPGMESGRQTESSELR